MACGRVGSVTSTGVDPTRRFPERHATDRATRTRKPKRGYLSRAQLIPMYIEPKIYLSAIVACMLVACTLLAGGHP